MKNNHGHENTNLILDGRDYSTPGLVSVIGPCYNEKDNIGPFIQTLESVLENEKYDYEILIVNDGSTDGSAEKLEELRLEHPCLSVIHLVRNFGQQGAMLAGIVEATGCILVTMDVDLQHPAEAIPEMIRHWEQGADVVYALPAYQVASRNMLNGIHPSAGQLPLFKSYTSKIYQSIITRLQEPGHTYVSTDFRLFDREVAEVIRQLPEKNLYLRNVFAWLCPVSGDSFGYTTEGDPGIFRSACIPYRLGHRKNGETKYTIWQLIRLGIKGLTNGGTRPLRMGIIAGVIALALSMFMMVFLFLYNAITWSAWEVVLMVGLFFGSIQLILLCLIGEYVGKIFLQSQERPPYIRRNPTRENKRKKWSVKKGSISLPLQKE